MVKVFQAGRLNFSAGSKKNRGADNGDAMNHERDKMEKVLVIDVNERGTIASRTNSILLTYRW